MSSARWPMILSLAVALVAATLAGPVSAQSATVANTAAGESYVVDGTAAEEPAPVRAWTPNDFDIGVVRAIRPSDEQVNTVGDAYVADVEMKTGTHAGETLAADIDTSYGSYDVGQRVVVATVEVRGEVSRYVADAYRLGWLGALAAAFVILVLAIGRRRGLSSLLGLACSLGVLFVIVIPGILAGRSPVAVTLVASAIIVTLAIFLAHGFNRRSMAAAIGTGASLLFAVAAAWAAVAVTRLFGLGTDEAVFIQQSIPGSDLKAILTAGIIIGTLGLLDDITSAQAATVDEIHSANPSLSPRELHAKAMSVGREHIASMVNTLVLAYAGASLPVLVLLTNAQDQPLWLMLNSEMLAEEIVRTLVGSAALVLAVPISTAVAVLIFSGRRESRQA